jgi:cysteine desulfuration protein SufE
MTLSTAPAKLHPMTLSLEEKIAAVKKLFPATATPEERYAVLMEMGRRLSPLSSEHKTEENRVSGCQSLLYLHTRIENGKIFFEAASDALISAGLAAILLFVYNGEAPETLLKHSPTFLSETRIAASLSPNRSNGLSNIHLKMKQKALKVLAFAPSLN